MADFASLKSEVQLLVIDVPTAVAQLTGTFVNRAIRKLQSKHNFKVMEAEITLTTTAFERDLGTRPDDWKEPRGKPYYVEELGGMAPMIYISRKIDAEARWGTVPDMDWGDPRALVENDGTGMFEVYPYPDGISDYSDGEYRVRIPYWKYLPDLSGDGDTNWFVSNAEEYVIYRATGFAFAANQDEERAEYWFGKADREFNDVLRTDKMRRYAETQTFVPHKGALPPHTQE